MLKRFLVSVCLLVLSFLAINVAKASQAIDSVVAIVNNDIITRKELDSKIKIIRWQLDPTQTASNIPDNATLAKQVLNKLILDTIQLQQAKNQHLQIEDKNVNSTIKELAARVNLTLEAFKQSLENYGINFDDFRQHIKDELLISDLQREEVAQNIVISNSEIDSFLNSPIGQDQTGVEFKLGHILIPFPERPTTQDINQAQQKAAKIMQLLKNGANFEELAIAESAGPSALKGGDLGWRTVAELPTIFAAEVPSMQVGQISGPIKSPSGFHVIRLLDKKIGDVKIQSELNLQHILLKTSEKRSDAEAKAELEALRKEIVAGKSFATSAQQRSEETASAASGGNLGWIEKKAVLAEFYDQVVNLNPGEISKPFKTALGWHLVKVIDKRNQSTSKEAYRNQAIYLLRERKFNDMLEPWLRRLKDNATVEILYK